MFNRRTREGRYPYKSLFQLDKWIPAFAGMTLRSLPEARNSDFFTRSKAGTVPAKDTGPAHTYLGFPPVRERRGGWVAGRSAKQKLLNR